MVPVVWRHACNTPLVEGKKHTEGTQGGVSGAVLTRPDNGHQYTPGSTGSNKLFEPVDPGVLVPVVWRHACNTPPVEGRKPTEGTQGVRGARAACQTTGTSIHRDPSAQTVCWSRWIPVYIGARCLACCRTAAGVGIFVWLGLLLLLVVLNLVVMVQQRHKATCHARNHDIGRRV